MIRFSSLIEVSCVNVKKLLQLFVGYLQIERNYSKYTIASYQNDLEHFVQFMEREGISSF